jgi:hypothetical protein
MYDSAAPPIGVDLDGVAGEVFEKASVIALVGRGVVERRIGERQDGCDLARRGGKLEEKYRGYQEHVTFSEG